MKYAVLLPNAGEYADVRTLAALAADAETSGWDGCFVWDHIATAVSPLTPTAGLEPLVDPWVALTAMAASTTRVRLGPMVTPVSRRRPWQLARQTVSLDQFSAGRLTLGVGAGLPAIGQQEFGAFGEDTDAKVRAAKLDEGLAILAGLWSGEPFSYQGRHYEVEETTFLPAPVQQPRIPVWVAAFWPSKAPFRRAAHWDGVWPIDMTGSLTPAALQTMLAYLRDHRDSKTPFEVVVGEVTPGDQPQQAREVVASFADAGATWWVEYLGPMRGSLAANRERIQQGPPDFAR